MCFKWKETKTKINYLKEQIKGIYMYILHVILFWSRQN